MQRLQLCHYLVLPTIVLLTASMSLAQSPALSPLSFPAEPGLPMPVDHPWANIEQPLRLPAAEESAGTMGPIVSAANSGSSTSGAAPAQAAEGDYFTLPELQEEMKKLVWTKGDFKIVPYGFLWGNMVYAAGRTVPGSYTLYVPPASTQGEDEFVIDARNTRLGFDVTGPAIPYFNNAASGGKVEIDFQNSVLTTENKPTVMLRHAYFEVKNEQARLLVGQTWDVISPLIPGTLMYSVGWCGGNMGYRRAQFRYERYLDFSDISLATLQVSLNQQVFEDPVTRAAPGLSIVGEPPDWPIVEMRVGWTLGPRGKGSRPITFGVSGHIGEEQFDVYQGSTLLGQALKRRTWSVNADIRIPITDRFGVQGEFFTGENLGAFLGGIGQGIDSTTFNCIRSNGGWIELWYDFTPQLHTRVGYSIDDPVDGDLTNGNGRIFNQFYYANLSYDFTKTFMTGIEVSSWRTLYLNQTAGDSVRVELMMKYGF